jgi:hypothetical protein
MRADVVTCSGLTEELSLEFVSRATIEVQSTFQSETQAFSDRIPQRRIVLTQIETADTVAFAPQISLSKSWN